MIVVRGPRHGSVRAFVAWFRLLLRLFPTSFRREYGEEMLVVFEAEATRVLEAGNRSVIGFWCRTSALTLACAAAEHLALLSDAVLLRSRPARQAARRVRFERARRWIGREVRAALEHAEERPWHSAGLCAFGLGLAIFSLTAWGVARAGLDPIGVRGEGRLVVLETAFPDMGYESFPLSAAEFVAARETLSSYDALGAWQAFRATVDAAGTRTRERAIRATSETFEALGLPDPEMPAAPGAPAAPGTHAAPHTHEPRPVYLAATFRDGHRGSTPPQVGARITIDGVEHRIAGLLPPEFRFGLDHADLWIPSYIDPVPGHDASHRVAAIGRLAPGVDLAMARDEAARATADWPARASELHGPDDGHPLRVRPLAAAAIGDTGPPLRLVLICAVLVLGLGLLHLPLPAIRRHNAGRGRFASTLAVCDLAVATGLLVGAALLGRSIEHVGGVDPGYAPEGLVAVDAALAPVAGEDPIAAGGRADAVLRHAAALPGVARAALAESLPHSAEVLPSDVERATDDGERRRTRAYYNFVSTGFGTAMGLRFRAGRDLAGPVEAVVSATLARRLWPDGGAVGGRLALPFPDLRGATVTVVGVVDDVPQRSLVAGETAQLYVSRDVATSAGARAAAQKFLLLLRTDDPDAVARLLAGGIVVNGEDIAISAPMRLDDPAAVATGRHRTVLWLLVVAGLLATGLAFFAGGRPIPSAAGVATGLGVAVLVRRALDPLLVGPSPGGGSLLLLLAGIAVLLVLCRARLFRIAHPHA